MPDSSELLQRRLLAGLHLDAGRYVPLSELQAQCAAVGTSEQIHECLRRFEMWGMARTGPVPDTWVLTQRGRELALAIPKDPALGRKFDGDKPRWDLLPLHAVGAVVDVLTAGARKYAPDNWRHVPEPRRRYYAAAMRHLAAWYLGEERDPETGLHHLAHATCCLLFLLDPAIQKDASAEDRTEGASACTK